MANETISGLETVSGGNKSLLAGRYRAVRQLGQGGMGSVWLAEDTELDDRKVAIKMLPTILISSQRALRQLKSEALVSLKLTHPNIATLRSFEENGGNPFLVMDFIDGRTLDDLLAERGALGEDKTLALLRPVAAALDYAHRENVVHRDIKPSNVMVRTDGTPFVLDFSIAREIQETMTRVSGHMSSGTLMYMSPEQLHGKPPTSAQDVYSFAAMAYECLAGTPPFHRGQIEFQILNDAPPPLPSDSALAKGILRGLSKDPAARPPSCLAVLGVAAAANRRTPAHVMARRPIRRAVAPVQTVQRKAQATRLAIKAFDEYRFADAFKFAAEADTQVAGIRFLRGYCYHTGSGVGKDLVKARIEYRAAAEQGHPVAQFNYATLLHRGEGGDVDIAEALKWYEAAAAQGEADACLALAALYDGGVSVPRDAAKKARPTDVWGVVRMKRLADMLRIDRKVLKVSVALVFVIGLVSCMQAVRAHRRTVAARQTEMARQAEAARQTEMARQAEAARQAEMARQAEAARQAEVARQAEAARLEEEMMAMQEREAVAKSKTVPRRECQPGDVWIFDLPGGAKMKFVWCPRGIFTMGSPVSEEDRGDDEKLHQVTLTKGFWLGQYEVTQAQWKSVMANNPSRFKGDDHPVEMVSWNDCQQFIAKCNATAKGVRFALPTEAQWEYACRAGSMGAYAGKGSLDAMGWYYGNGGKTTHLVGQKQPNAWNLYDMHGNVWEWCADWKGMYGGDCTNPTGLASSGDRVLRGGSWNSVGRHCRSASRRGYDPSSRFYNYGFRLVCTAESHE